MSPAPEGETRTSRPTISTAALGRALRSLDAAAVARFVADLWTAQGFETTVDGTTVLAERPDGPGQERLVVGPGERGRDADAVIDVSQPSPADGEVGIRVIGVDDLRERLLFAIDRETADGLARRHLGRSLAAETGPSSPRTRLDRLPRAGLLAVGVAAVIVVGLALAGAGGPPPFDDTAAAPTAAPTPPAATATPPPFHATRIPLVQAGPRPVQGGGELARYPPGLGPSGVTDVEALAAAHRSVLAAERWQLRLVHDGSFDLLHPSRTWRRSEQTVVRTSPARYRLDVTGLARFGNGSLASVTYVDYGDGTANYRREFGPPSNLYRRTRLPADGPPGVFSTVSGAYVRRYLATTESRVEPVRIDGQRRILVVATGSPTAIDRPVADYAATAVVDRRGVVHRLAVVYTQVERHPDPTPTGTTDAAQSSTTVTVRFEMSLSDLGTATLTEPSWYEQARNATGGSALPPWPNDPAV